jgi:hypothetical protein
MDYRPDTLVLSSGSDKGMAEIGALEKPYETGMLNELTTIIGCSVGAILISYWISPSGYYGIWIRTPNVQRHRSGV